MALDKFRVSPLPNPPTDYDQQFMRQFMRTLEIYFSQLDSNTPNHAEKYTAGAFAGGSFTGTTVAATSVTAESVETGVVGFQYGEGAALRLLALIVGGTRSGRTITDDIMAGSVYANDFYGNGEHINTPYNQFQSDQDQTASAIDVATAFTMNVTDFPDGITIASSSRITVNHAGVYSLAYSVQFQSTSNSTEQVDIWLRKNGTDVPASNSQFSLPARKSAGIPSSLIAVTPFMLQLAANDYVQVMWRVTDLAVTVQALPAVVAVPGTTPAIPATPSVIVTMQFISAKYPKDVFVAPLPVFGFGQVGTVTVSIR